MSKNIYDQASLMQIAKECIEFEHVISAMGYGYSLLNVSPENYFRQCSDCINWSDANCDIFQREIQEKCKHQYISRH